MISQSLQRCTGFCTVTGTPWCPYFQHYTSWCWNTSRGRVYITRFFIFFIPREWLSGNVFSVVVLSFRSATACLEKIREQMRRILQLRSNSSVGKEMENAFQTYMRRAWESFDLAKNIEVNPKDSFSKLC